MWRGIGALDIGLSAWFFVERIQIDSRDSRGLVAASVERTLISVYGAVWIGVMCCDSLSGMWWFAGMDGQIAHGFME